MFLILRCWLQSLHLCAMESKNLINDQDIENTKSCLPRCYLGLRAKLQAVQCELDLVKARLLPEERVLRIDIFISAGLYYLDIGLDAKTCFAFIFDQRNYNYLAAIVASVVANGLVSRFGSNAEADDNLARLSILGPAAVVIKTMKLKASPAAGKIDLQDLDLHASHKGLAELRRLRTCMQHLAQTVT